MTYQVSVSDIKCGGSGVKYNMSSVGVRYHVSEIECQVQYVKCRCQILCVRDQVSSITSIYHAINTRVAVTKHNTKHSPKNQNAIPRKIREVR